MLILDDAGVSKDSPLRKVNTRDLADFVQVIIRMSEMGMPLTLVLEAVEISAGHLMDVDARLKDLGDEHPIHLVSGVNRVALVSEADKRGVPLEDGEFFFQSILALSMEFNEEEKLLDAPKVPERTDDPNKVWN